MARFASGKPSILIAEDNFVNQKVAVGMLDRLGIRADVAGKTVATVDRTAVSVAGDGDWNGSRRKIVRELHIHLHYSGNQPGSDRPQKAPGPTDRRS